MKSNLRSSLSRRLIVYIVLCSSAITLVLTAFQLYRDYQTDVRIIDDGFEQIRTVHLKSIEATVWATDTDKLQTLLDGLSNLPDIEYVAVTENGLVLASVGKVSGANQVSESYPLVHLHKGKKLEIGVLKVVANLDSAFRRLIDRAVVILASNAVKTALVAGFMLLIFHFVVTRHLIRITDFVSGFPLERSFRPLSLDRKPNPTDRPDELDQVVKSINDTSKRVIRDFADLQKTQALLGESEERLRAFLDNVPALVSLKTLDGEYLLMNTEYSRQFGLNVDTPGDYNTENLFPADVAKRFAEQETRVIKTGESLSLEHEVPHVDGTHIHFCTKFPILDGSGTVTSIGTISTDITELKHAEEDRRQALMEAEQANQAKSEFLATMSHELRTPLNAILGFADILSHQYFGPPGKGKYREYAEDIHSSGEYLMELINDLLDISTIETGRKSLLREKLDAGSILSECARTVGERAYGKGVELAVKVPANLPHLYADKRAMKQILLNLLSNAVKFTPEGGKILVEATTSDQGTTFRISDTGKGIDRDRLPNLTDPFIRAAPDPYVSEKGWGLGLTITQSLVDLHDGTLNIESKVGEGTTVTVTLPNGAP